MTTPRIKSPSTPHRPSQGNRDFRKRTKRNEKIAVEHPIIQREKPQTLTGTEGEQPFIVLKEGREKSLMRHHPWVFSGAIDFLKGALQNGDTVAVRSSQGKFIAWAAYNADSQITARLWSWQEEVEINADFFRHKIKCALAARNDLKRAQLSTGMRLIHGEADGLPGLIVDQYGEMLVMQIGSAGAERWRELCADILQEICNPVCIYERSDSDSRALEGLEQRNGLLRGEIPEQVEVIELGLRFKVDVAAGQKTGFFLDQIDNRSLTETLSFDKEVLNCFCYTGGFSLYALRGGAKSVLSIDSSAEALRIAEENLHLNGLDAARAEWWEADVFTALRKLRDQGRSFDLIILDPPKFAPTAAFAEKAARGYKDINLLGFKLLRPGGILATYSCSGGITEELFQKIIAGAALDAGVDAQIIQHLHASADHPVLLSFPESAYLKGLVLRVGKD
jgi:23S rRNA (cytosine1962-C5)-methyltransferase